MERYTKSQIETLLRAIDEQLTFRFDLIIIGGTAAALGYRVTRYTKDIDTIGSVAKIQAAYEKAIEITGLDIPLGPAAVEDGPYHFEDRLVNVEISGLKHLAILVPEKHDLALMKVIRGQEHDLETIAEIHGAEALSYDTLVVRMRDEMIHVHGNKREIFFNFLAMVERVFGEAKAKETEKLLKGWDKR